MIHPTDFVRGQKTRKEVEREKRKAELGVCRIRKLFKDGKGCRTVGSGSVIRNLLIDWPGYKDKYCLVTTDKVLPDEDFDVKDFVLDFRKLNSTLREFKLANYANNKAVFRFTSGLVVIPLYPKGFETVKKPSIFTFRSFTRESGSSGKLFCPTVEDTDAKHFTVRKDFALKQDQLGSNKYVLYDEHSSMSFSTLGEFIGTSNRKPHGAVILSDKECKAVGILYCTHDQPSRISPIWLSQENLKPSSAGLPEAFVEKPLVESPEAAKPHSNEQPSHNEEVEVSGMDKEDATTLSKKSPKKSRSISESTSDPEALMEHGEEARPSGGYWVNLRITEFPFRSAMVVGALAGGAMAGGGVAVGGMAAGGIVGGALIVLINKNLGLVEIAVRAALEKLFGCQVWQIKPCSILVDLHCNTKESFLSFMEDFETGKVKQRLEEEFKKVGYEGELEVAITNYKEVHEKLDQIRKLEQEKIKVVVGETLVTVAGPSDENLSAPTAESFIEKLPAVHTPDTVACPPLEDPFFPDKENKEKKDSETSKEASDPTLSEEEPFTTGNKPFTADQGVAGSTAFSFEQTEPDQGADARWTDTSSDFPKFVGLDGCSLSPETLVALGKGKLKIKLTEEAIENVSKSRAFLDDIVRQKKVVYGVTTGFGKFSTVVIPSEKLKELQENLIRSHAAGVGPPLSIEHTRMLMALRINVLAKGYSGISVKTLQQLIAAFNESCLPWVPEQGTVGAGGDLAPLAHLALGLLGEGQMWSPKSGWADANLVLEAHGLEPLNLEPKEGLSLINGTQLITSLGAQAVERSRLIAKQADVIAAMSLEALKGTTKAFDPLIHQVRPHIGQGQVAERLRSLLDSKIHPSEIAASNPNRVQDAYSLRCCPQVHGVVNDTIDFVQKVITTEINSVSDNPIVFADQEKVLSGGNIHGEYPAKVLDYLAIGVHELASISERRIERLVNPAYSELPAFLVKEGGLNSGFMIAHCTAASLVSENKVLCHPASIDSLSTSAGQEDHVSMGGFSARKAVKVVENVEKVLAIELMIACQGIDLLRPLKTTEPLEAVHSLVRKTVKSLDKDRFMAPDIEAVLKLVKEGKIWEVASPFMKRYLDAMKCQ